MAVFMKQCSVSSAPKRGESDADVFNFSLKFFAFFMWPDIQGMDAVYLLDFGWLHKVEEHQKGAS